MLSSPLKQANQKEKLPRSCLKLLWSTLCAVLETLELSKALNICALVSRFVDNLHNTEQKVTGLVMSEEFQKQHLVGVKKAQQSCMFEDDYALSYSLTRIEFWNAEEDFKDYILCISLTSICTPRS